MSATTPPATRSALQGLLCCVGMLLAAGILMSASAGMTSSPQAAEQIQLSKHLGFVAFGTLCGVVCAWLPARFWYAAAPWLFGGTLLLLIAVLIPGVGSTVNGAQRWIRAGSFSIQPSETAKLTLPLLLSRLILTRRMAPSWQARFTLAWPWLLCGGLIVVEPDLGTTVFITLILLLVLWLGQWPARELVGMAFLAIPAAATLLLLKPYQWRRIEGFLAVWTDPADAPYQVRQSLTTLGVGGWWGTGLGQGWQKLSFLPEANTDFVFAVIGEELGLVGTLSVVALWLGVYWSGKRLFHQIPAGEFASIAGQTILTQLVLQAAINVAVVTALLPPKGIPHPFLSYGGSSLLVSCMSIGMVISLARPQPEPTPASTSPLMETEPA